MQPKVFVSYSWSSSRHQELVKSWADRLIEDGVEVILDIYELKEGQDKYAFMESMVIDKTVTHVLVICDKAYSEKADARVAGVGTESQIISKGVYDKVNQTKFIPIVCEYDDEGEPYTPIFMRSRIYVNFSSLEAVNENWEQLIRLLNGKPLHQKPPLGKPPAYITTEASGPISPSTTKFNALKQALLLSKPGLSVYRSDFLSTCLSFADQLRVRSTPDHATLGEKILADSEKLKGVRDQLIDWVLLEAGTTESKLLDDLVADLLEKLLELRSRPVELSSYNDRWFEAHQLFVYETFIYIVAALLKSERFSVLKSVFESHYLLPKSERYGGNKFEDFGVFWASSTLLDSVLKPANGGSFKSTAAELIKLHADRQDITFSALREAELLILLMSNISGRTIWYPQTLLYASFHEEYDFFLRATQHKNFLKLQEIVGPKSVEEIRAAVKKGSENLSREFRSMSSNGPFWDQLNLSHMDTL